VVRTCTICHHHRRDNMDNALLQVSSSRLSCGIMTCPMMRLAANRKTHVDSHSEGGSAGGAKEHSLWLCAPSPDSRIRADAERVQVESERRRDVRSALRAMHERLAVVELEAKLSQIDTSPKNVTIHLQTISPEEAIEYARDILELFGNSTGQHEFPALVLEGEPEIAVAGGCDGN
jgi:hypothetical protein